ncbi:hypothetical protein PTMSG1_01389 [Pyrenophora teres f. maculata]|nr:hypothetical protein PTMSG1_01389 [Pyrenophora teres f. maculata]
MESATGPEPTEVKMKSYAGRYRNKASSCHVMIEVDKEQLILTDETCPTQSKRYILARCKPTTEVGRATSLWVALPDNTNSSLDKKHAADEDQPTGNHISFFAEHDIIRRLTWKTTGAQCALRYEKINAVGLLELPHEVLVRIIDYILTADDKIIHIPERSGRLRIATCRVVPYADANSAFDIGYRPRLPEPFNQVQFVSKKIFDLARGRELTINHLKVNGWTFDTFRRLDQVPPASASEWFVKVAWLIQEAIRGILRPTWVAPKDKLVQSWRRGKDVDFMNPKNVRFKPSDEYGWQKVKTPATKTKKVPTIIRILNEFGSLNEIVAFVKNIYSQGI